MVSDVDGFCGSVGMSWAQHVKRETLRGLRLALAVPKAYLHVLGDSCDALFNLTTVQCQGVLCVGTVQLQMQTYCF